MGIGEHNVCCGVSTFQDEDSLNLSVANYMIATIKSDKSYYQNDYYEVGDVRPYSRVYEAILPDYMLSHSESYEALKKLMDFGFKLVTRFKNSNTGNFVNVYHYKSHRSVGDGTNPLDYAKRWAKK